MRKPRLIELITTALYIGTVGYGGPAILAQMKKKMVHEKKWISEKEFMGSLSLAQILPGAVSVTLIGYLGQKLRKGWGGILLPLALIFPSIVVMTVLARIYFVYGDISFVRRIFQGLGALVVALLVNATVYLGSAVFKKKDRNSVKGILVALPAFILSFFLHWNIILIILISGILGFFLFFFDKSEELPVQAAPVSIKEETKDHFEWNRIVPPLVVIVLLSAMFFFVHGTWDIFSRFFKIGALAFGGGYTSIPLIQNEVVTQMHWLSMEAFRDGIALGQVTPGPVLITATFIGFKLKGILGGLAATIGIFSPSLTAILLIGNAHAAIRDAKIVKPVISGFLAGFIGLIFTVALQFGMNSLVNWQSWLIFLISLLYLMLWKKEPAWLILGTIGISLLIFKA